MLTARLEAPGLKKTLGKLMDQLQNKLPLFKTWGRAVELKAKTNARNYGGRRIWRNTSSVVYAVNSYRFTAKKRVKCRLRAV